MSRSGSTEMQTNYVEGRDERGDHRPNPADCPRAVPYADVPTGRYEPRDYQREDQ